jgi:hypothetical protein
MRIFDWLMLSLDGTGRISQGDLIRSRYEIGGGIKISPAPGVFLYANVVRPYPRDSGLREKYSWRVGGQIEF